MPRPITFYLDARLFEWAFSVPMIFLGVSILISPAIANGSILHVLVGSIGALLAALVFVAVGITGIVALIANGRSMRVGPRLRSLSAVIRSILWLTFTLSMVRVSIEQGFRSPMVFFWSSFIVTELYISFRAALDVRPKRG
jgi:hypothetical protein